jgi:uncharacterized protein (DUF433 family)
MNMVLHTDPVPLRMDEHGALRFAGSRVTLDVVLADFKNGLPTETIARGYDTVAPADVYAAIAYYLRHTEEVEAYLQRRNDEAELLKKRFEDRYPVRAELATKLRAPQTGGTTTHDPAGE